MRFPRRRHRPFQIAHSPTFGGLSIELTNVVICGVPCPDGYYPPKEIGGANDATE